MKRIAIPTNDKTTISEHFGRSKHFLIFELDGEQIKNRAERINPETDHSHHDHSALVKILKDCSDVICLNLGMKIYHDLRTLGIKVHLTEERDIEKAVKLFAEGKISGIDERPLCHGGHNNQHRHQHH